MVEEQPTKSDKYFRYTDESGEFAGEYEGEWWGVKRHGYGKATYPNGCTYEGNWDQGLRHGRGKMIYMEKDKNDESVTHQSEYDGNWNHGKREGLGFYKNELGHTYEGEFKNGKMHGEGKYIWPNEPPEAEEP